MEIQMVYKRSTKNMDVFEAVDEGAPIKDAVHPQAYVRNWLFTRDKGQSRTSSIVNNVCRQ